MNTPLNATRRRRCETLITGAETNTKFVAAHLVFLARTVPEQFLAMLTDDAVEGLAFEVMRDRVFRNKLNARNRAIGAGRAKELQGV